MNAKQRVAEGYDGIAEHYLAAKNADDPVTLAALEALTVGLPSEAAVLDLGCGAGVPVTRWLAARFRTTGVDVSARQVALARENATGAIVMQSDITALSLPTDTFDAIVSFYAIIHVPREEHLRLLADICQWLKPGGRFLATWPMTAWEGEEADWEGWGMPMWWSHFDAETNLTMLRQAGFHVASADARTEGGETWLWVVAEKPA